MQIVLDYWLLASLKQNTAKGDCLFFNQPQGPEEICCEVLCCSPLEGKVLWPGDIKVCLDCCLFIKSIFHLTTKTIGKGQLSCLLMPALSVLLFLLLLLCCFSVPRLVYNYFTDKYKTSADPPWPAPTSAMSETKCWKCRYVYSLEYVLILMEVVVLSRTCPASDHLAMWPGRQGDLNEWRVRSHINKTWITCKNISIKN